MVAYVREVLKDLEIAVAPCQLHLDAPEEIQFAADRAILVALIINELVLNAAKHAYPDRSGETVWVQVVQSDKTTCLVSVRDDGVGLPAGYDPTTSKRLGTRLVTALSKQLDAKPKLSPSTAGTNFAILIPLERVAD